MSQELIEAFTDMREADALRITDELLASGTPPLAILEACREGLAIIGQRFDAGQAFIPELILAGEMMKGVSVVVKPKLQGEAEVKRLGKVLVGTVAGDIHDIGKDIVVFMLDVNGFDVIDLGVDVPVETFVNKIKEVKPDVVGLSGLLTLAFDSMKQTVQAIEAAGLRNQVKIMIGGATINQEICEYVGADAFGPDAMSAVTLSRKWLGIN